MRLDADGFYCANLACSPKDLEDIGHFEIVHSITGKGLVDYLKDCAVDDEQLGAMRTYFVRMCETDECVGYFSLKAGLVSLQETEIDGNADFDTLPGVELANFAVNKSYVHKYHARGIGRLIFTSFILPLIRGAGQYVGVCLVYLFSLPHSKLMKNYESYGFHRLTLDAEEKLHHRLKPSYDQSCIFMCQPLYSHR